ncbi:MAG: hypothetical protein JWQ30_2467 [Sediminibacterium sp.]|nr:hypothetical protein [Sediminibacterium sp.]
MEMSNYSFVPGIQIMFFQLECVDVKLERKARQVPQGTQ